MGDIRFITAEWKDWVRSSLRKGHSPDAIIEAMIDRNFHPRFANAVVYLLEDEFNVTDILDNAELNPSAYHYETPRFPQEGGFIEAGDRRVRVVARYSKPVIAILDGVLSHEECDQLMEMSRDKLERSTVLVPSGQSVVSDVRTSKGTFVEPDYNDFIVSLNKRLAAVMHWPIDNGEPIQILHYGIKDEYTPHYDFFENDIGRTLQHGGQRVSTLVMYLNDVEEGGETVFPEIGLSVSPKKGSAVYFEYTNSLDELDYLTLHGGKPVIRGEKWIATKWMRQRPLDPA